MRSGAQGIIVGSSRPVSRARSSVRSSSRIAASMWPVDSSRNPSAPWPYIIMLVTPADSARSSAAFASSRHSASCPLAAHSRARMIAANAAGPHWSVSSAAARASPHSSSMSAQRPSRHDACPAITAAWEARTGSLPRGPRRGCQAVGAGTLVVLQWKPVVDRDADQLGRGGERIHGGRQPLGLAHDRPRPAGLAAQDEAPRVGWRAPVRARLDRTRRRAARPLAPRDASARRQSPDAEHANAALASIERRHGGCRGGGPMGAPLEQVHGLEHPAAPHREHAAEVLGRRTGDRLGRALARLLGQGGGLRRPAGTERRRARADEPPAELPGSPLRRAARSSASAATA